MYLYFQGLGYGWKISANFPGKEYNRTTLNGTCIVGPHAASRLMALSRDDFLERKVTFATFVTFSENVSFDLVDVTPRGDRPNFHWSQRIRTSMCVHTRIITGNLNSIGTSLTKQD